MKSILHCLLLLIPVGAVVTCVLYEPIRELWYTTPLAVVCSFIVFYNIPWLVRVLHLKPTYYEDLIDDESISEEFRYKFQNSFTIVITIFLSLTFCIVLDYIFYNFKKSELSWQEKIGIIGGGLSLYGSAQRTIGSLLLFFCMRSKEKKQIKRRLSRSLSNPLHAARSSRFSSSSHLQEANV